MRVLLTGITGVLGEPLAARLARDPEIEEVIGVARRKLPASLSRDQIAAGKIRHLACDFRDARVGDALAGVDTLIHAAFQPYGRDEAALRAVNVDGSVALHRAALAAGVRHIVFVSSVAAYGSHPDNPIPMTESAPLRPNPESFYSVHKAEVERDLDRLGEDTPELDVLTVRPTMLLGPRADAGAEAIRRYYHRLLPRFRSDHWLWQFVRTDDAVEAIARAVTMRLTGPLNIAGEGWLTFGGMAAVTGGRIVTFPDSFARMMPALQILRLSPVGKDRQVLSRNPMVLSTDRMKAETRVVPASSERALREFLTRPAG